METTVINSSKAVIQNAELGWRAYKIIGSSHYGNVNFSEVELEFDGAELIAGKLVVDLSTITNKDLSGDMNQNLVGHLKSADFFDAENFPTSQLVFDAVTQLDGRVTFEGEFTIKGETKKETIIADVTVEENVFSIEAHLELDRTKYGVKFGSTSFFKSLGDNAIKNYIDLDVKIKGALNN